MKIFFWVLWSIAAVAAGVVVYFFFWGLSDGSVSSFNILLWLTMLGAAGGIVGGSLWLRSINQVWVAIGLLLLLALPALLFALFFLVIILTHPRWN